MVSYIMLRSVPPRPRTGDAVLSVPTVGVPPHVGASVTRVGVGTFMISVPTLVGASVAGTLPVLPTEGVGAGVSATNGGVGCEMSFGTGQK